MNRTIKTLDNRIDKALKDAKHLYFNDSDKFVLMSDCHRGDGSRSDDFANNQHLYYHALTTYYDKGFSYIELGDGDELWENKDFCEIASQHNHVFTLLKKFYDENRIYFIYGNHDMVKKNPRWISSYFYYCYDEWHRHKIPLFDGVKVYESIVLHHIDLKNEILLIHGHQADFFNDRIWKMSRFLVRYLWRHLEIFGFNDPTGTAKNYEKRTSIEENLSNWSKHNKKILIAGHTHRPVFPKPSNTPSNGAYFNDGSCVHPRCITAIEIENSNISLVKWSILTQSDGTLTVIRDIVEGPEKLSRYI